MSETGRGPSGESGGCVEERQTGGSPAERHGKQLPQTRRPGFRGYKSRDPDRRAAERGAARRRGTGDATGDEQRAARDGQRATDNKRRTMNDERRNERWTTSGKRWTMDGATGDGQQAARGWTAMDGDGRRAEEVRNGGRKTRRNTDAGGRTDKAGELPAERATGRGSYGQRELRAGKRKT